MANTITQLEGKKLTAAFAFCLREQDGHLYFKWFDMGANEALGLTTALTEVFHEKVEISLTGLEKMLMAYVDRTKEILDRDRRAFASVSRVCQISKKFQKICSK